MIPPAILPTPAPAHIFLRRARRSRRFVWGVALCLLTVLGAIVSLAWTPWPVNDIDLARKLQPPGWQHWLGTDAYGRDVASHIMAGAGNALAVGCIAAGIGLVAGTALGLLAATVRGRTERIIMRLTDFVFAFPALILAILLSASLGAGIVNSIIAIGIFNIPVFTRIARASASAVWEREFVLAARALGKSTARIAIGHVLPNIRAALLVQATSLFAVAILAEAALAYLGLGTQPPSPSWGRMLSEAQTLMFQAPQLAIFPGLAIAITVMGLGLLGDGLRDLLDPRLAARLRD